MFLDPSVYSSRPGWERAQSLWAVAAVFLSVWLMVIESGAMKGPGSWGRSMRVPEGIILFSRWAIRRSPTSFGRGRGRALVKVSLFGWSSGPRRIWSAYFLQLWSRRRSSEGSEALQSSMSILVHWGR